MGGLAAGITIASAVVPSLTRKDTMSSRLGAVCAIALAALAIMTAFAATAQALPTCESAYAPTSVTGSSNAASALTAVTVKWKIPSAVEKELSEQVVNVWVKGGSRSNGRKVTDKAADRSFTFNNSGEKGETSEGTESGFIEPNTSYESAVTAIYGKSTKYPEGCSVEGKGSAVTTRHIFGTNGGLCCSKEINAALSKNAETLIADDITADRLETYATTELEDAETYGNGVVLASEHHFVNNDVIVGNTPDEDKLSTITTSTWAKEAREGVEKASKYGDVLMEVGNEMWLKGDCEACAEPSKYAEMFVALSKEVQKAKEESKVAKDVKLLFDLTGDYYLGGGKWSNATEGRGWLGDALKAQSELKTRIEGFTFHPYDVNGATLAEEEGYVTYEYDYGLRGLKRDYEEAVELGIKHTNVYATEFGVCVYKECNSSVGEKSEAEKNKQAETDWDELLSASKFPEVKGLWWFQAYPVEEKYSFWKGWGGGEETGLVKLVKELAVKG
jgi:hypothetical protein